MLRNHDPQSGFSPPPIGPPSLNVVALISGGKDSLFSLLHCIQNGHKVVALANLHPPERNEDSNPIVEGKDANSYMYQTVGHSIIPFYTSAIDLPMYRREIKGSAIQIGRYYDATSTETQQDETEDLVPLLQKVMLAHPEVNAVSSGAILSTYQRTRIESVALRLGLAPLAFLWQYPALPPPVGRPDSLTGLLDDMAAAGCDARIIKIASGGIKESFLWTNVTDQRVSNRLISGMMPFFEDREFWLRGAVLGEGGEYETLAIGGPPTIWKKKIEIKDDDNVVVRVEGGVSHLRFGRAKLIDQTQLDQPTTGDLVRIPTIFDYQFSRIRAGLQRIPSNKTSQGHIQSVSNLPQDMPLYSNISQVYNPASRPYATHLTSTTLSISNITAPECCGCSHQIVRIMSILRTILQPRSTDNSVFSRRLNPSDIVFSTILLSSVDDFNLVNPEYAKLFPQPNPPARVTIACGSVMPESVDVSLSVIVDLGKRSNRRGLHVQSRSYWAPANIGPYSQAICVPIDPDDERGEQDRSEVTHVAGQIPLMPQSMELLDGSFCEQAVLSLQHLWRVGQERGVDAWTWGVAYLDKERNRHMQEARHRTVCAVWNDAHRTPTGARASADDDSDAEDEDDGNAPDAWDLKHNRGRQSILEPGNHLHILPKHSVFVEALKDAPLPPLIISEVDALPRSAPVEWHSLGLANMPSRPEKRPRMTTWTKRQNWGRLSCCSVYPAHEDPGTDEEEEEQKEEHDHNSAKQKTLHFLTLQIYTTTTTGDDSRNGSPSDGHPATPESAMPAPPQGNPPTMATILSQHLPANECAEIIHATAYIASRDNGWPAYEALSADSGRALSDFPAPTLVPCRRVWGDVDGGESGAAHDHSHRAASASASASAASAAATTDDKIETENNDDDDENENGNVGDGLGASTLKRLALAVTMRVDSYA